MSRSRRRSPFVGHTTAERDKEWQQQNARKMRRAVHQLLDQSADGGALPVSRYAKVMPTGMRPKMASSG